MVSKIWIASKPVPPSNYEHLYLVYDPDGNPNSGDEYVFRGGPQNNNPLNLGSIIIEDWKPILISEDKLNGENPFLGRNYTELNLNGMTPEQFKSNLSNWAYALGTLDGNGQVTTAIPYSTPIDLTNSGAGYKPALNSNTTIKSALISSGIDFFSNSPQEAGSGIRMPTSTFGGVENYYTASDSTVNISNSVDSVIYSAGGNNTYVVNANSVNTGKVFIVEDHQSGTLDKLVINNLLPSDVRYERSIDGSLNIYFPWDAEGDPSIVIPNQWKDGVPAINNLWIYPPDGSAPTIIPMILPENVPLNLPDFIPSWLAPIIAFTNPSSGVILPGRDGSPLILDLNGDGAHSTQLGWVDGASTTYFDMDNDGFEERTAWVSSADGLLVIDRNGNGKIDNQSELFGNDATYTDGFANLRQYDSSNDNKITTADAQFTNLRVWVDADSDGQTDAGELKTLTSLGITQINLAATALTGVMDNENDVTAKSTFIIAGQSKEIADHWFRVDQTSSHYIGDVTLDIRTFFLPTLKGFGDLKDLHIAMSQDSVLLNLVTEFTSTFTLKSLANSADMDSKVSAILYRWAGADTLAGQIYHGLNLQNVTFYQKMVGGKLWGGDAGMLSTENYSDDSNTFFSVMYHNLFRSVKDLLLSQIVGPQIFDNFSYNLATGDVEGNPVVSAAGIAKIESDLSAISSNDRVFFWNNLNELLLTIKSPTEYAGDELARLEHAWDLYPFSAFESWQAYARNYQYGSHGYYEQGTNKSDFLMSHGGSADWLIGLGGDDYLIGADEGDNIYGGDGNDHIDGKDGGDNLYGESGDDIISAGRGTNQVSGGIGNDTYIYGGGSDTISDAGGIDKIIFDSARPNAVISFERDTNAEFALNIKVDGILSIVNGMQFADWLTGASQIEQAIFANGTVVDLTQFRNVNGTSGNDNLVGLDLLYMKDDAVYANEGNDTLKGGLGNDLLVGGTGDDAYIYNVGDGSDTIRWDTAGNDTISFGAGFSTSNIVVERADLGIGYQSDNSYNLLIKSAGQNLITIVGQFNGSNAIETIKFSNGTSIDLTKYIYTTTGTTGSDILYGISSGGGGDVINGLAGDDNIHSGAGNDTVTGGDGNDFIYGEMGDDVLIGGLGSDHIYGGVGNDTVIYDGGYDVLLDDGGADIIKITNTSVAASNITVQRVDVGGGDVNVLINGSIAFQIQSQFSDGHGYETIQFANGTSFNLMTVQYTTIGTSLSDTINGISYGGNPDDIIHGGDGDDHVNAGLGNDTINGGKGIDLLNGGAGNDIYQISLTEGADIIHEIDGNDTIVFGVGFDKTKMTYQKSVSDSNDLQILFSGTLAVTVDDYFLNRGNVETLKYSDGATFSLSSVVFSQSGAAGADTLAGHNGIDNLLGLAGSDYLYGWGGNDILIGGAGSDTLNGDLDDDTYTFLIGDGTDIIYDTDGTNDSIKMGSGVLATNIRFEKSGNDLNVYYGTSDKVTIQNQFLDEYYGGNPNYTYEVEKLILNDGTTYNLLGGLTYTGTPVADNVMGSNQSDSLLGLAGNDYMHAGGGNDILIGGAGNDTLNGDLGDDAYTFVIGDGTDTIYDTDGTNDSIKMGSGVLATNIRFEKSGNDLNVYYGTSDKVIIQNQFLDEYYGGNPNYTYEVEKLILSDGTTYNLLGGLTYTGTSVADNVMGSNQSDSLMGLAGNDYIYAGAGIDSLNGGVGNDTIDGGDGIDTAIYSGVYANYTITGTSSITVKDNVGTDGIDILTNIEKISFSNGTYQNGVFSPTPTNSAPVLGKDNVSVNQNGLITINVLANDSDPDGNAMMVTSTSNPSHGAVLINADNTVKYTPTTGYYGDDTFLYTVSDSRGGTATQRVNITVIQVAVTNAAPVAGADSALVAQNGTVDISVLSNDTDANGDILTVASVGSAAHGTVVINANNTLKYTPVANYSGADSFTYTVSDGRGGTAIQTVSVTVSAAGPNSAPVLGKDNVSVNQNGLITINVLANDSDPDGNAMTVTSVSAPSHGAVIINADNTVKYTPTTGYYGDDTFLYTVSDGHGGTATQRVNITVNQVAVTNVAPVAVADSATVAQNSSVIISVLANDSDANGDTLTVASVGAAAHGAATINANGTVTYTPTVNYSGADSFTYTVSDGHGGTASQTVNLTVSASGPNSAPVLGKDNVSVNEDQTLVINVLANDSDANGDTLAVTSLSAPSQGTAVVNANNTVTYTPSADYYGDDTFLYTVSDGHGGTATQRINITVSSVPDAMIEGTNNPETITGTAASETIAGLGGADTLYGGVGNDTLYGGYGADILYGQAGADVFSFDKNSAFAAIDTIKDFSVSGGDKIDLKDLLVGYDAVTKAITDFVELTTSGANTIAKVDRDGTGTAYGWQQIAILENVTNLTDETALKASGSLIVA